MAENTIAALEQATRKKNKGHRNQQREQNRTQTQIESKLSILFNRTRSTDGYLPNLADLGEEGVDHINVSRNSKTRLGYLLSSGARFDFHLFGRRFTTIENLLLFYRTHCTSNDYITVDIFSKSKLNQVASQFPPLYNMYVVVCLAYISIFKKNPELLEALNENTLPLDAYIERRDRTRTRHKASRSIIMAIQEAQNSIRDKRDPQLGMFMFRETSDKYNRLAYETQQTFTEVVVNDFAPERIATRFKQEFPDFQVTLEEQATETKEDVKECNQEKDESLRVGRGFTSPAIHVLDEFGGRTEPTDDAIVTGVEDTSATEHNTEVPISD